MNEQLLSSQANSHRLIDKAIALVGTSDPLAFQAVQAMTPEAEYDGQAPYDPSDEGEIARLEAMGRIAQEDTYSGEDYDIAAELGVEPGFFVAPADDSSRRANP
jgi:hypothetical protein